MGREHHTACPRIMTRFGVTTSPRTRTCASSVRIEIAVRRRAPRITLTKGSDHTEQTVRNGATGRAMRCALPSNGALRPDTRRGAPELTAPVLHARVRAPFVAPCLEFRAVGGRRVPCGPSHPFRGHSLTTTEIAGVSDLQTRGQGAVSRRSSAWPVERRPRSLRGGQRFPGHRACPRRRGRRKGTAGPRPTRTVKGDPRR